MSKKQYQNFVTPVGRLVQGAPSKGWSKDNQGNNKLYKTGDKKGEVLTTYYMGLALAKDNPETQTFIDLLKETARLHVPAQVDEPDFAFKIIDGDSTTPNKKQKKPCDQVGFPGHYVIAMSNDRIPTCYQSGAPIPAEQVKTGYYIRVSGSISGHGGANPGLYINHGDVELVGFGELINSRPDGATTFKNAPKSSYVPAGMQTAPPTPAANMPKTEEAAAPPPPSEEPAAAGKYMVGNKTFTRSELLGTGWKESQIAKLTPA